MVAEEKEVKEVKKIRVAIHVILVVTNPEVVGVKAESREVVPIHVTTLGTPVTEAGLNLVEEDVAATKQSLEDKMIRVQIHALVKAKNKVKEVSPVATTRAQDAREGEGEGEGGVFKVRCQFVHPEWCGNRFLQTSKEVRDNRMMNAVTVHHVHREAEVKAVERVADEVKAEEAPKTTVRYMYSTTRVPDNNFWTSETLKLLPQPFRQLNHTFFSRVISPTFKLESRHNFLRRRTKKFGSEVILVETFSRTRNFGQTENQTLRKIALTTHFRVGLRRETNSDWTDVFAQAIVQLFASFFRIRIRPIVSKPSSLLEKLERNEIDLVAVPQPLHKCRSTSSTAKATQPILVKRPVALVLREEQDSDVFVKLLWTSWGAKLVTTLSLCVGAFKLSSSIHWKLRPDDKPWTLSDLLLWAIAAIAQQGTTKHPKGLSCRVMFALGYMMAYFMYTAFAAAVCSLLASAADNIQLQTRLPLHLDTLTDKGKIVVLTENSYFGKGLETVSDTDAAARLLLARRINGALTTDVDADRIFGSGSLGREACRLRTTPILSNSSPLPMSLPYSLVVSRNSIIATHFEAWLIRLREIGLQKQLLNLVEWKAPCNNGPENGFQSAGLNHVTSAFYIYLGGVAVSTAVLLGEVASATLWFTDIFPRCGKNNDRKDVPTQFNEDELPLPFLT